VRGVAEKPCDRCGQGHRYPIDDEICEGLGAKEAGAVIHAMHTWETENARLTAELARRQADKTKEG
jgi:hypothetical protein